MPRTGSDSLLGRAAPAQTLTVVGRQSHGVSLDMVVKLMTFYNIFLVFSGALLIESIFSSQTNASDVTYSKFEFVKNAFHCCLLELIGLYSLSIQ